jgi:hypothetical protein
MDYSDVFVDPLMTLNYYQLKTKVLKQEENMVFENLIYLPKGSLTAAV